MIRVTWFQLVKGVWHASDNVYVTPTYCWTSAMRLRLLSRADERVTAIAGGRGCSIQRKQWIKRIPGLLISPVMAVEQAACIPRRLSLANAGFRPACSASTGNKLRTPRRTAPASVPFPASPRYTWNQRPVLGSSGKTCRDTKCRKAQGMLDYHTC